jgi:hypothetical protein
VSGAVYASYICVCPALFPNLALQQTVPDGMLHLSRVESFVEAECSSGFGCRSGGEANVVEGDACQKQQATLKGKVQSGGTTRRVKVLCISIATLTVKQNAAVRFARLTVL